MLYVVGDACHGTQYHLNLPGQGVKKSVQVMLAREVIVVGQKKAATQALIASIGQEKTVVDEAVNSSRADEDEAAALSV